MGILEDEIRGWDRVTKRTKNLSAV